MINTQKRKDICKDVSKNVLSKVSDSIREQLDSKNPLPDKSYVGDNTYSFNTCVQRFSDGTFYTALFRVDIRIEG